jgi:hypothetical protein
MIIYVELEEKMHSQISFQQLTLISLLLIMSIIATCSAVDVNSSGMVNTVANNTQNNPVGSPYISLVPESTNVEVGDSIVLHGVIDKAILGLNPGNAILIIKTPQKSKFNAFTQVPVNNDGSFTYSVPTDVTGAWTVSVRYSDEISASTDITVSPRAISLSTINTLNSYGAPVSVGEDVNLFGFLRDSKGKGIPERQIKYIVAIPPYGCDFCSEDEDSDYLIWETYGTATTDSSGKYSISITPHDRGEYKVKTYFGGDEGYQSSTSDIRRIRAN